MQRGDPLRKRTVHRNPPRKLSLPNLLPPQLDLLRQEEGGRDQVAEPNRNGPEEERFHKAGDGHGLQPKLARRDHDEYPHPEGKGPRPPVGNRRAARNPGAQGPSMNQPQSQSQRTHHPEYCLQASTSPRPDGQRQKRSGTEHGQKRKGREQQRAPDPNQPQPKGEGWRDFHVSASSPPDRPRETVPVFAAATPSSAPRQSHSSTPCRSGSFQQRPTPRTATVFAPPH